MYITVKFYNCENVNYDTKEAFEAFFKTIEDYFGNIYSSDKPLRLNRIHFELRNGDIFNTMLIFELTETVLVDDDLQYYSKILGCKEGWTIKITKTPLDES